MNRGRIDVACFRCYLKLETVPDTDWGPVPRRNIHGKVYSSQGASHRYILLLLLSSLGIIFFRLITDRDSGEIICKVCSRIQTGMFWSMVSRVPLLSALSISKYSIIDFLKNSSQNVWSCVQKSVCWANRTLKSYEQHTKLRLIIWNVIPCGCVSQWLCFWHALCLSCRSFVVLKCLQIFPMFRKSRLPNYCFTSYGNPQRLHLSSSVVVSVLFVFELGLSIQSYIVHSVCIRSLVTS